MSTALPTDSTQQFLSFFLPPSTHVILPTRQLTEVLVLTPQQMVPIPAMDPHVMGVCNWRGEVLWLMDLGLLLGGDPLYQRFHQQSSFSVIIVHHHTTPLGLVVDQVNQMLWCDAATIQPIPTTQSGSVQSPYLQGYWLSPEKEVFLVLNSDVIVTSFQFS